MADVFDDVHTLEQQHISEGHVDGCRCAPRRGRLRVCTSVMVRMGRMGHDPHRCRARRDGKAAGWHEGRLLGLQKGFEIGAGGMQARDLLLPCPRRQARCCTTHALSPRLPTAGLLPHPLPAGAAVQAPRWATTRGV